ncbi:PTS sugar transporter subunit IIC [Streptococcus gallolyticus]|uniref:PTS sugar transporter subunit IIC n=1 Tax=Streptococcus hepaticus TaxID=3349163 RepID=UPI001C9607FE|nr:PTS sugar transporter subunit IIC [Streptococcus gallolyticus]MBY5042075.1 PTS sugar transporter subunit IIC [Streptococcus gallolyticus]
MKFNIGKIQKFAGKISNQRHLIALRDGMATAMPLIIIGSVFMLIANFPVEAFAKWLETIGISAFLNKATDATFGIVGLVVTFAVAYHLAKHYNIDRMSAGMISLASFVLLTPVLTSDAGNGFPLRYLGTSGLFVGIIAALVSTEIFKFFVKRNIVIKMPDTVPPNVAKAFSAIIPGGAIITMWFVILMIFKACGIDNVHALIANTIAEPLSVLTKTLPGILVVILIQCFFWMFGIHGAQVTGPILEPLLILNSDANRVAFQAGQEVPNIITYEFLYNFVFSGGAGCVMALAILVFFRSKSQENKALGKLSIAPVSFQVAEPLLFGFPTILNFRMVIPFVMAPVVTTLITYYAMYFGWVAKPIGAVVPWTTPPVIAGYLASGNKISGAVIQIVTILVSMLIYYPFFKMDDNEKLHKEQEVAAQNK